MAFKLSPVLNDQQFSDAGILLSGGKIETYLAGSSTPATTYTSPSGAVAQSNPIILNTRGEVDNLIYLTTGISYKLVLKDSVNNVLRTYDNIEGVNDSSLTIDQWVNAGVTPTFVSATQFTLSGDQTSTFTVGRRGKFLVTAGTVYGTITASVFGALTTVTVVMDSTPLDSGLSSVQLGLLTPTNGSLPFNLSATSIQKQSHTSFTTGGTASAYTLTPSPAITANATNTRFNITLHLAPTGSPTLAVSGQAAKSLKYYNAAGVKQFVTSAVAPLGWNSDVVDDGTDWIMQTLLGGGITFASDSELQAGTETAKAITPSNIKNSLGFSKFYQSPNTTFVAGANTSVAHGLGVIPRKFQLSIVCTTADANYSIGDEVLIANGDASGVTNYSVYANATVLGCTVNAGSIRVTNKTTFAVAAITAASWRFVFRAWA